MRRALTLMIGMVAAVFSDMAHAQIVRDHLVVRSGVFIQVYKTTSLNPDCSSRGHASVSLVVGPRGGQASVADRQDYVAFALGNPRSACNRRKVPATEIFYRSEPGFVGVDTFTAEIIDTEGVARRRNFVVEVR